MKQLSTNAIFNVLKTFLSLVFPLITFSYASRIFLADGIGKLDFSKSLMSFFVLMATSGIRNYGIREAAKVRDDHEQLNQLARELITISVVMATVAYAAFFGVLILVPKLKDYSTLLLINSLSILLGVIGMEWLFHAMEDFRYVAIRSAITQLLCLIAMFIFIRTGRDLWKYALIQVMAASGNSIWNLFRARKYLDLRRRSALQLKRHIRPLALIFCSWLFIQVFTHLDTVMLGMLRTDAEVGLYAASHKISTVAGMMITSITTVLMPRLSYYSENGDFESIHALVRDALSFLLMIGIPAVLGLMAVSREVLLLFSGEGFLAAEPATRIMAIRVLLVPVNSFLVMDLLLSLKQDRKIVICTGGAALLNLVLNSILIPRIAQNGAAIATVAAEAIELIINLYFLRSLLPRLHIGKSILQFVCAAIPIIPITVIIGALIGHVVLRTALIVSLSALAYAGILLLLRNTTALQLVTLLQGKLRKRCIIRRQPAR